MPAETSKNVSENVATRVFAQQLAQEREHVAKIYARLDDLREETSQKLADVRKNQAASKPFRTGLFCHPLRRSPGPA